MTPEQSHQRAQIMLKHGQEGWIIQFRYKGGLAWSLGLDPTWKWEVYDFRAVRIDKTPKRTPLPIEYYKRGMEVKTDIDGMGIILFVNVGADQIWCGWSHSASYVVLERIVAWRWPHETEWKPAYTEVVEEKVVECLEV